MATSIEDLREIVAQIGVAQKETSASIKELAESQQRARKETDFALQETERALKKGMDELRGEMAESRRETDLALQETQRVLQKTLKELRGEMAESRRETDLSQQKTERTLRKMIDELGGNMGGVNQRLGEIVELVVLPGLMKAMNDYGHKFTMSSPRKKFSKNGRQLAEVDLLLENCEEVMVVEAKSRFKTGEMNGFLAQLELLRKNEKIAGMAGKTIYAAAAGIGFDPEVRKIAKSKGIYLVDISVDYDNEKLKITPPPKGKAGKW